MFTIDGIDGVITANTVNLVVPVGTDLTALVPMITLSGSGASVIPGSGCKLLVKKGYFIFLLTTNYRYSYQRSLKIFFYQFYQNEIHDIGY